MSCIFFNMSLDVCGICTQGDDAYDAVAEPDGQRDGVCIDPENFDCSHYDEGEDE